METLNSPVYEVRQDSEWYKNHMERKRLIKDFFRNVNSTYFKDSGFSFYHSTCFGIQGYSADYETYKSELLKNPNKDGVHLFKKKSKYFNIFREMLEPIGDPNPFKIHDVFGLNNAKASQTLKGRWFFEVGNENLIKDKEHKEITPIDYKEYLTFVMENLD